MNCPKCGSPIEPGALFCPECGLKLSEPAPKASKPVNAIPKAYKPISPWGYIGWNFLFAIPIVGFILLIVMSFSKKNINRRNYARSFWCALLIVILLLLIGLIVAAATGTLDELIDMFEQIYGSFPQM